MALIHDLSTEIITEIIRNLDFSSLAAFIVTSKTYLVIWTSLASQQRQLSLSDYSTQLARIRIPPSSWKEEIQLNTIYSALEKLGDR